MDEFTFCGRVIQAISEMIMEDTIQGPDINSIHTVFPDIVTNTEVGYIGEAAWSAWSTPGVTRLLSRGTSTPAS